MEKFLNGKNHCIIIGTGIGFILCLVYKLTNNKIYVLRLIENLNKIKNIDYLFFKLYDDILNKQNINEIFSKLKKLKFKKIHSFLNSYYFRKVKKQEEQLNAILVNEI